MIIRIYTRQLSSIVSFNFIHIYQANFVSSAESLPKRNHNQNCMYSEFVDNCHCRDNTYPTISNVTRRVANGALFRSVMTLVYY